MKYVKVLINKKVRKINHDFQYSVPLELEADVRIGAVVSVPFGNQTADGIVIGESDNPENYVVKDILDIINRDFSFPADLIDLSLRLSEFYSIPMMSFMNAMIPPGINLFGEMKRPLYVTFLKYVDGKDPSALRGLKQRELYNILSVEKEISCSDLILRGFSYTVIKGLSNKGYAEKIKKEVFRKTVRHLKDDFIFKPELNGYQKNAVNEILDECRGKRRPVLLHGVTGSGKTEIYLRVIEDFITRNQQVIILFPEISLTPQFISLFENRFPGEVAVFHSRLSQGERRDAWLAFRSGKATVALGVRSCVFAPAKNLGLLIIDEEHEDSYEQDSAPRFHARRVAEFRCEYSNAQLILGSATPSLESYHNAVTGNYRLVELPERVLGAELPEVRIVDMREELRCGRTSVLSAPLISEMNSALDRGEQIILFLNRLGYHTFVSCRDCGYVYQCPECGVSLRYFRSNDTLRCSRCSHVEKRRGHCPQCGGSHVKYFGLGTEQLEEIVKKQFPGYSVCRMDSESLRKKGSIEDIYNDIMDGNVDIIIGTRTVSKGWDFPGVSLIGIIAVDYSLNFPDFRAGEKTFQMISQVSGRCGRRNGDGKVILQTYQPDQRILSFGCRQDYKEFYYWEMSNRQKYQYPPFFSMIRVYISFKEDSSSSSAMEKIRNCFEISCDIKCFGPSSVYYTDRKKEIWCITFLGPDLKEIRKTVNNGILKADDSGLLKNINLQIETEPMHSV